jgi:signal transduction histidine kinase
MRRLSVLLLVPALLLAANTWAAGQATQDEAKAMAVKAAEYLKSVGPDKAFADFDAKDNSQWHDRDLYVTVQDNKGTMLAHGTTPSLIGKPMANLRDVDGKAFEQEILAIKDAAWVDFKWLNPVTKAVEPKRTYEIRMGEYIVGVGAYVQ